MSAASKRHFVEIIEIDEKGKERVERKLGPYVSWRQAEKADAGVNINLNHERFFTRITPPREEDEASS